MIIHLTGGEPLLYPDFVGLCETLTKHFRIGVNTNLSSDIIYDFINRIDPQRVAIIHCAVHIKERLKYEKGIERFIERFLALKRHCFRISANYVAHPTIIHRMADDIFRFQNLGVKIVSKIFRGKYKNRVYPQDYTSHEKNEILRFIHQSCDREFLHSIPSYKGRECRAGRDFIVIFPEGDVYRCTTYRLKRANDKLGNIFYGKVKLLEAPIVCEMDECLCPYQGMQYAEYQNDQEQLEFQNNAGYHK